MDVEKYTTKHCVSYLTKGVGDYDFVIMTQWLWISDYDLVISENGSVIMTLWLWLSDYGSVIVT